MAPAIQICRASRDWTSDAPEAGVGVGLEVEHLRMTRGGFPNQTRLTERGSARRVVGDCAGHRRDDAGRCQQRLFKRDELDFPRTRRRSGEARTWTETSERVPSMDSRMRRTPPGVTQDAIVCCLRSSGVAGAGEVRCGRALAPFSKLHPGRERKSNSGEGERPSLPARAGVSSDAHVGFHESRTVEIGTNKSPDRFPLKLLHLLSSRTRPRSPCRRTPRPRTGSVRPSPPLRPDRTPPSSAP